MHLLALLHRWAGGLAGLLLAVLGLSGTVLVWEEAWIGVAGAGDPLRAGAAEIGDAVAAAYALDPALSRITFADARLGLHQVIYADGSGAYLTQGGAVAERWDSLWGRPELWLFDLHHYLFLGENGKYVTGTLGLLLLAFALSGLVLWWRTRRTFRLRPWPARLTRSAIVRHHRDIGVVAAPLLLMAAATGALMVFQPLSDLLLSPWAGDQAHPQPLPQAGGENGAKVPLPQAGGENGAKVPLPQAGGEDGAKVPLPLAGGVRGGSVSTAVAPPTAQTDWRRLMVSAQAAFPRAAPRRLALPQKPGEPVVLRLRQPFEWTPNGRTYVRLDPATAAVLAVEDPAAGDTASAIAEKFYPLHAGKVGGLLWQLALTFAGLALVLLGTLATWSFWFAGGARQPARRARVGAPEPAE